MHELELIKSSLIYSFLGIAIMLAVFWIVEKIAPQNLWKEIVEKQNMALAVMSGFFMLAIAWIIGSAIHG